LTAQHAGCLSTEHLGGHSIALHVPLRLNSSLCLPNAADRADLYPTSAFAFAGVVLQALGFAQDIGVAGGHQADTLRRRVRRQDGVCGNAACRRPREKSLATRLQNRNAGGQNQARGLSDKSGFNGAVPDSTNRLLMWWCSSFWPRMSAVLGT
jgi:hypothetical protein